MINPFAIALGVFAVIVGALSYKAAKDAQKAAKKAADAMGGVLINKESNIEPIPVIYGERRVGGVRVFVHTEESGSIQFLGNTIDIKKNDILFLCLVLCEGEVQSITDIEIDDSSISDSKYLDLIEYEVFTGTNSQSASSLLSRSSKWTSDHKLSGVAYIAMMLKWDQDAFSGIPEITALVKGRKVYDPRNGTTVWSDNPALCIRDYLTNSRYGKGLPSSAINDNKFSSAANDIDSFTVTPYSGGPSGHKIFKCNAVLDTGEELFRNVERLLLGCRGFLPYSDGRYGLVIDQSTSAVMTLNSSKIIGGINIQGEEKKDKFNRVIVTFPNPNTDWQPDQAIWPDAGSTEESSFQSADGGAELVEEIDMETVTDYYAARDFARISCLRSRNALRCTLTATSEAINLVVGDVVNVTHPTPGWSSKPFQVEQVSLKYDGTVELNLIEYDSTIYAYDASSEEASYPDTDLPDPSTVEAPTILTLLPGAEIFADGTVNSYVQMAWTASNDGFVVRYDVRAYEDQADPADTEETYYISVEGTTARINGLVPGITYNASVIAVNSIGNASNPLLGQFTAVGDSVAPASPTNVSAVGNFKTVDVSWTNPSDADLSYVEIKESTTSTEADAVSIGKSGGESFSVSFPNGVFTRYYWVRAVDTSGNASSWVAAADNPAVTILLGSGDFADGIIDFDYLNTTLQTRVETIEGDILANESSITSLASSVSANTAGVSANSTAVSALDTRVTANEGSISTQASQITSLQSTATTLTTDVSANSTAISGLDTRVTANETDISSQATSLTSLTTTVGTNSTSITSLQTTTNGISAQFSVVIDNNDHVSGFGLISDIIAGNPTSQFIVNANQFAIGGTGSASDTFPFVVYPTGATVNGVNIPAGAYMDSAYINYLSATAIETGSLNLGNQSGMSVRQGKTSYTSTTSGFWLGNDSGTAKFNIGDANNKLTWDGTTLEATGLVIKAEDGTVLIEANGTITGIEVPKGNNLIIGGDFDDGDVGWVDYGPTFQSVVFDEFIGTATAQSSSTKTARAVQDNYINCTENETLYLYSIASGTNGWMAIEWFSDNGSGTLSYNGANAFSGTGVNQSAEDDQAFSTTKKLRSVELTVPSGTNYCRVLIGTAANGGSAVTFYQIGLSRTPPVINPSYAPTYIRNASIDTAQIRDAAIETAKIGDAAVETLKIAGQAVTFPEGVFTASAQTTSQGTSGQVVAQTVTVTSTGAPTEVMCSFAIENTSNISGFVTIRLRRGTTVLSATEIYLSTVDQTPFAAAFLDTSTTTGSRTYTCTIEGFTGRSVTNRYLRTLELKR